MPKVYVIDQGRRFYYLQWTDPLTGQRVTRSSKCTTRRDAERKAFLLENQLSTEGVLADGSIEWETFRDAYETRHLGSLAVRSEQKAISVLSTYESNMAPRRLADLTTATLTTYASKLRKVGRSEATIAGHLSALRAALNWGKSQSYLTTVPKLPAVARNPSGRLMRGRPLTSSEFARMLRAVRDVVPRPAVRSWRHYLRGLWLSGLRLKESLSLTWDDSERLQIVTSSEFPMLSVAGQHEKGFRDRLLPLTPDFAVWLLRTPEQDRTGCVFNPIGDHGQPVRGDDYVGKTISAIGQAARVIVDHRRKKFASAHDLRRSFGTRWARRVSPQILRELMRHSDISTTMRYYVDLEAEGTAQELWKNWGGQQNAQQSTTHP